jgi:hypothetical protein
VAGIISRTQAIIKIIGAGNIILKKSVYKMPILLTKCSYCKKEIKRKSSDIKRHINVFCGRVCYGKWRSENQKGENNPIYKPPVKRICKNCGIEYGVAPSFVRTEQGFHSLDCYYEWRKKEAEKNLVEVTCIVCKEKKKIKRSRFLKGIDKTCSKKCEAILKSRTRKGKNNPNYIDGTSGFPYCILFNQEFRERVRLFFGNRCVYCGKTEKENGKNLSVHHVTYQKGVCCEDDDVKGRLFVTLCASHHPMTNSPKKREYWKDYFTKLINEKYGGRCYYTENEYEQLKQTPNNCAIA